jgi:uncharacterized protein YukE
MTTKLSMDYDEMRRVGRKYEQEGGSVWETFLSLSNRVTDLYAFWQGDTLVTFQELLKRDGHAIDLVSTILYQVGQALIATADSLEAADLAAARAIDTTVTCDDRFQAEVGSGY